MQSKALKAVCSAIVVIALATAGCGGDDESAAAPAASAETPAAGTETPAASGGDEKLKVGLILPCAINDGTWCQQAYEGAKKLEDEGAIELKYTSNAPQDTAGVSQLMATYAQEGTDLVIGHSSWQDSAFAMGEEFPDVNFSYAAGGETAENVSTYEEPHYETDYLAGMIAGSITKSGVVAGLAGQDIPACHAGFEAFKAGAERTRKGTKMLATYIGDWQDVAKAKEAALAQVDQGADVFIGCGDGPTRGMAEAMIEHNLSGFGYAGNMNSLAPKHFVGSVVYNLYTYYKAMVDDLASDQFRPGKSYKFGVADEGHVLELNADYAVTKIPPAVMDDIEKVKAELSSGSFEIPFVPGG
jgi:simple sugar transport system substrate-binding protein/basic membrane protein A